MTFGSTLASTAPEAAVRPGPALAETCREMLKRQLPNFFRLYLNPFAAGACFCLDRYVRSTWFNEDVQPPFPSFLANSFDEALSGAIKLARFTGALQQRSATGLVLDWSGRLGHFASIAMPDGGKIEFVPQLHDVHDHDQFEAVCRSDVTYGFIVSMSPDGRLPQVARDSLRLLVHRQAPLVITCVDRASLAACRRAPNGPERGLTPDIVIFDESFVEHQVPFAAFTARKSLFDHWNKPARTTFHSTTFQPNTIASLHFLRCLEQADPHFHSETAAELERIGRDPARCASLMADLYSSYLVKAMKAFGFDTLELRAQGHYVVAGERKVFDGVAGIASSMRGHNPESYLEDLATVEHAAFPDALARKLSGLTGLDHLVPAVSGATAVENALRLGLAAQYPKQYVVAFKGGFGGKTLLALTGTARSSYKEHLDPLYEKVIYLDPFAPGALDDLEATLAKFPVGIVQLELIQAVGGIRALPERLVRWLVDHRGPLGYLLFVDEIQTGMYRTGTFTRSQGMGITPDLLTLGKGVSDMMFPFALTMYSSAIQKRLDQAQPRLAHSIRDNYDHEFGYRTLLAVLQRCEWEGISASVQRKSALFASLLRQSLADCKAVREVRVHGLLIAIELDASRWPQRWLGKRFPLAYLLALARQRTFPLFTGFCQYEPHVLKLTPPLSITEEEIRQVCATIADVLHRSYTRLLLGGALALAGGFRRQTEKHA